ncbi:MAG: hypothetical protein WCH30_08210 [Chlorobiaceae bacterium]
MQLTNDRKEQLSWSTGTLLHAAGKTVYKTREPNYSLPQKGANVFRAKWTKKPVVKRWFLYVEKM